MKDWTEVCSLPLCEWEMSESRVFDQTLRLLWFSFEGALRDVLGAVVNVLSFEVGS